jgi:hypothetical protein
MYKYSSSSLEERETTTLVLNTGTLNGTKRPGILVFIPPSSPLLYRVILYQYRYSIIALWLAKKKRRRRRKKRSIVCGHKEVRRRKTKGIYYYYRYYSNYNNTLGI